MEELSLEAGPTDYTVSWMISHDIMWPLAVHVYTHSVSLLVRVCVCVCVHACVCVWEECEVVE